jgi:hypothetical protein
MGKRDLDSQIMNYILSSGYEEISFVGAGASRPVNEWCTEMEIEIDNIDIDPRVDGRDAIFDDILFSPLVVVFHAEKHYPIGKKFRGDMILIGDNDQHNGDCNPIDSTDRLIQQNEITEIYDQRIVDKWYVVYGNNTR